MSRRYDTVVVGAGVFGAWTAWHLHRRGKRVLLVDAHDPGHARASSGGETRIIRLGYGPDRIYTEWAQQSLQAWRLLERESSNQLFVRTGVLWLSRLDDPHTTGTRSVLSALGVPCEELDPPTLAARFPQIGLEGVEVGVFEPASGVLFARRGVQAVVNAYVREGGCFEIGAVRTPIAPSEQVTTVDGRGLDADHLVFACGAWLPQVFPQAVGARIQPTRQEVCFFGVEPGDRTFAPSRFPVWACFADGIYALPDLDGRGVKVAVDRHGPTFDPDRDDRLVAEHTVAWLRDYLARRMPALARAPLLETRVCQYENTSSGDFLIDRHPDDPRIWIVGGGSGHGFKHGPAVGAYVANLITGSGAAEPRFALASKQTVRARQIY
jgi:sarcosine oxidase